MDNRKIAIFLLFFVSMTVIVQQIQIQKQRDNWRKITLQLQVDRANASVPVAAALAAAGGPVLLSALVLGTGAYYCWTHGGKEAYWQLVQATKDGVAVTKDWVQKQIAELNGIDTSSSSITQYNNLSDPTSSSTGWDSGYSYTLSYQSLEYSSVNPMFSADVWYGSSDFSSSFTTTIRSNSIYMWVFSHKVWGSTSYKYYYYKFNVLNKVYGAPAPGSSFDPANYQELYTGPALLSNCHAVARAHPDLIYFGNDLGTTTPPPGIPVYEEPPYIVATYADGSAIDNKGVKWPPLPGAVWPGIINPPIVAPGSTGEVPLAGGGTAVVPQSVIDKLRELGIPEGAKITQVAPDKIVWEHTNGTTLVTPAPASVTAPLAPAVAGSPAIVQPAEAEADPGNPADIDLPALPTLDTEWDWGVMDPWDWSAWIAKIPFLSVLSSASIQLSGASSTVTFPVYAFGRSDTATVDFAEWEFAWNTMGIIIYACACWWALQLAVLKNG